MDKFILYAIFIEECIEHTRLVYNLQESETSEVSDLDSSKEDSDNSTATRRRRQYIKASKKRMSLLTGQYFDVPSQEERYGHYEHGAPSKSSRRRFFASLARWDPRAEKVFVGERGRGGPKDVEEDVVAVPVVLGDTQDIEMTGVEGVDVGEGDDEEDDEEGEVDGEDEDFAGEGDGDEAKFQKTSFAYDDMVY